jgi:site-specific recombinase XerD
MSTDAVTPLRQRMIEDMNARKLGAHSQRSHIYSCRCFAAFLKRSPDTAAPDDVRRFQLHLAETGMSICNRNRIMTGVKFLFRVTLRRPDLAAEIYHLREPQKIPLVMSQDETRRLLAVASSLKVRVLLSLGYGCGLRAGEVVRLKVKHTKDHSGGAVQGTQGPQCHAVARDARPVAPMVEGTPTAS